MQISTKISTQIVLNQDEIKEAIIDFVKAKTTLPADAKFDVEFEDDLQGDLSAIVDIAANSTEVPVSAVVEALKAQQPKSTRAPKVTAPKPQEPVAETEKPNISENPEDRQDPANPEDPPFDVDPPADGTAVQDPPQTEKPAETPAPVVAAAPKIFPQTGTSAPTPPVEEPDPATKAKSLFANLTKPTN